VETKARPKKRAPARKQPRTGKQNARNASATDSPRRMQEKVKGRMLQKDTPKTWGREKVQKESSSNIPPQERTKPSGAKKTRESRTAIKKLRKRKFTMVGALLEGKFVGGRELQKFCVLVEGEWDKRGTAKTGGFHLK